jgi:membrane protein DedA with SNARE-associated domain
MPTWATVLPYLGVFAAAALEGEVVFITASVAVGLGKLNAAGVLIAGALGGSAGDQFFFHVLRGRLGWLSRIPVVARRHDAIVGRLRRHETIIILCSRFLPGLRTPIAAACAYAGVRPLTYSILNLISAFAWAASLLTLTAWVGPSVMAQLGLPRWAAFLVPAVLVVGFFYWISRVTKQEAGG